MWSQGWKGMDSVDESDWERQDCDFLLGWDQLSGAGVLPSCQEVMSTRSPVTRLRCVTVLLVKSMGCMEAARPSRHGLHGNKLTGQVIPGRQVVADADQMDPI